MNSFYTLQKPNAATTVALSVRKDTFSLNAVEQQGTARTRKGKSRKSMMARTTGQQALE
ncbi:MAG: hypothetical protein AAFR18_19530 [Cyanobacteria bacterium J06627_32]